MKPNSHATARLVASALLVLWLTGWHAALAQVVCLSGLEVSIGTTSGSGANGVTFAGTDNALVTPCPRPNTSASAGGAWIASINRTGPAGLGHTVSVIGGKWFYEPEGGTLHSGAVTGGWVMWPDNLSQDKFGCGQGVAKFNITLLVLLPHPGRGTFEGCLDDTHLDPRLQPFVFPPQILGKLSLGSS